ncbi:MAG: pyrimidine/purine nucleoside phosphorylase [Alphaproteobacteria bacterium]|nr:pyrimidine/purine nucleoside phosphorylase [Alphaproteobacteria bacterium]
MSNELEFQNVCVAREANVYFDGKVTSRTITMPDGSQKTLGVMLPGEYEFGTQAAEEMDISSGDLDVLLPDADDWVSFKGACVFHVPAEASFKLKVHSITHYCCTYLR